ncbi:threonine-phosphate decarboxylase CobD [Candidatus Magnetominusculus xianensis]|uniref:threonine-phosphate decarboxylase n=1 Tax=Candidatus Magnetominusculus xianensis TaxID=1748249 RepID=A0ABR5SEJ1_9BACT|nr:threonine-phosphate decarboxylase CobD [Candidatus Magnetominusculus xianensis]KWT81167.1 threonine-phosphate decarboxylase [Candidatus Magnetominusculus xianensis]MBF0404319.1 threonine-phosphate decarboxylase [Nitrospirota bacterium]
MLKNAHHAAGQSAPGHGGDVYSLATDLRTHERKILDFSASVNPLGTSKKVKAAIRKTLKLLPGYPDPNCTLLRRHISKKSGVPDKNILCGNGSTELIYLIARAVKPAKALIAVPAFSEYERALSVNGVKAITLFPIEEKDDFQLNIEAFIEQMIDADIAFVSNPNTPTGHVLSTDAVLSIVRHAELANCYIVIDEAFLDFVPQETVGAEVCNNPRLLVLRSLTKFYAISGLRLGALFFHDELSSALTANKEPWSVNTLAQRAGVAALNDRAYEAETFKYLKKEKVYMEKMLRKLEINFFPSNINFYLVKDERAPLLYEELRKRGILLRDCSNFHGLSGKYLRIAVKSHRENALLFKNISSILRKNNR